MQLPPGDSAISLAEAALRLGLTTEAVRKRVARGTLRGFKRGREWLVIVPDAPSEPSGRRPDTDDTPAAETLAMLHAQLSVKDQQIERQQTEVERLTVMLADAQGTIRGLLTASSSSSQSPERPREAFGQDHPGQTANVAPGGAGEAERPSQPPGWGARIARFFLGER